MCSDSLGFTLICVQVEPKQCPSAITRISTIDYRIKLRRRKEFYGKVSRIDTLCLSTDRIAFRRMLTLVVWCVYVIQHTKTQLSQSSVAKCRHQQKIIETRPAGLDDILPIENSFSLYLSMPNVLIATAVASATDDAYPMCSSDTLE